MFRDTFYGQTISSYGRQYGRVDYRALANSFDAVLCNSILGYREGFEDWEQIHGFIDNSAEIEDKNEQISAINERLEELEAELEEAKRNLEDLEEASENIDTLLDRFDSFEYEAGELSECAKWSNFETPSGEDFDYEIIEHNIDSLDLWGMREAIEHHQDTVTEEKEEAEELVEELEKEAEELTKRAEELKEELEELELEDSTEAEYYQYYIIGYSGMQILTENTNEAIWYNEELDIYVWGVTHWGTAWDYVLTSIPCETYEETAEREEAEAKAEAERKARAEAMTEEEEAEELEELLELWETEEEPTDGECIEVEEEADPFDSEDGNTLQAWIESMMREHRETEETIEAEAEESEHLDRIDWAVASVGDIVIGKPSANSEYGITTEGWKGVITRIDYHPTEADTVTLFYARDIRHEDGARYPLEPKHFDVFMVGGEE